MNRNDLRTLALGLVLALAAAACASGRASRPFPPGRAIGRPMELRPILSFAFVDATPEKFAGLTLLVEGRVKAVCQQKGCWMQIEEDGRVAWVRWESGCGGEYAFPKDAAGKRVLVQGSFYRKTIDAADAEHLKQEAGGKLEVARETCEFNASAVRILD